MSKLPTGPVLLALHRVGPYHHARFKAASAVLDQPLLVLETRPNSQEYPWSFKSDQGPYMLLQLEGALDREQDPPQPVLRKQLQVLITTHAPAVIITVGWADAAYLELLWLGQNRGIPLVVVSDSRSIDMPRNFLKEEIKSQLLRGYSAAMVAGFQSRNYLMQLGFSADAIFQPWDVVDNHMFAKLAAQVPLNLQQDRPFLCVGRFIPEKNHVLLLRAFRIYQLQGGCRSLVLVGYGPLESEIRRGCAELPDPSAVSLVPFEQLEQLGSRYAQAQALILPSRKDTWGLVVNEAMASGLPVILSSACGCEADLLEDGVTGWRFDAHNPKELADCLRRTDQQSPEARQRMINAARSRLSEFSPEAFAHGLLQACQHACARRALSVRSRVLAYLLQRGC